MDMPSVQPSNPPEILEFMTSTNQPNQWVIQDRIGTMSRAESCWLHGHLAGCFSFGFVFCRLTVKNCALGKIPTS